MAQQGLAGEALTASFTSSFIGAFFAVVILTFLAPIVADFALAFGPAELFAVQLLTFCSFVGMGKEPPMKTIASMMFGFARSEEHTSELKSLLRITYAVFCLIKKNNLEKQINIIV